MFLHQKFSLISFKATIPFVLCLGLFTIFCFNKAQEKPLNSEKEKTAEQYFQKALEYYNEQGDYQKSWETIEKACTLIDDPRYQIHKAKLLFSGMGVKMDRKKGLLLAEKQFNKLLKNEDAFSIYILGYMYQRGLGVKQNYYESLRFYFKAAEKGHAMAMNNIGDLCAEELPLKDHEYALKWYRKAAEKGNSFAMRGIGAMYNRGLGVKQNFEEASKWYRKSIEKGNRVAMRNLANMYHHGDGVEQNFEEAIKWYLKSAEKGYSSAMNILGMMYQEGKGVEKNPEEAIKWYHKAIEKGNRRAMRNLAIMYYNGDGVKKDPKKAMKWFRMSEGK